MTLRVVSHGGGVQTTAMLVLAAQGKIDYRTFLLANVGDDSEHPGTLRYLREIAVPYATKYGITIHELHATVHGKPVTIRGRIEEDTGAAQPIPAYINGVPANRHCTSDFKIEVIGKWLKTHGASPASPAVVAVGISLDEIHRVNTRKARPYQVFDYPLLDLRLRRSDCECIIREAGLPVPGKSACYFCPFTKMSQWEAMRRQDPALFAEACTVEASILRKRERIGREPMFLTARGVPLAEAVAEGQDALPGLDADPHCDNGWCMT